MREIHSYRLAFLLLFWHLLSGNVQARPVEAMRAGWLEQVRISPPGILLHAKLDTGADTCSLHASALTETSRKGEKRVRFVIQNRYGDRKSIERKVIKMVKIKQKGGRSEPRPVVAIGICLGKQFEVLNCNIVDRSEYGYPLLIGRDFFAGRITVDSSETYLHSPECD